MSGGVDSSVAALLLKKQGYDVYGAFMKNGSDTKNKITGECAWVEERNHAIKIATKLDIPFVTLDFEKEYKELVVDEMFKKYKQGVTPNPDIDCNQKIKFPMFIKEAKKIGIDFIATGHYARIKEKRVYYLVYDDLQAVLVDAISRKKDQQATINHIIDNFDEYKEHLERLLKEN